MNSTDALALPVGTTLDRYIKYRQDENSLATGDFSQLLRDIALAGKIINRELSQAGLLGITDGMGRKNVQGEDQQKLDWVAHVRLVRALKNGGVVAALISEEIQEIIHLNSGGRYIVCIDPLDGSSNIQVNASLGTIFSIYHRLSPVESEVTKEDFLQPGRNQLAAGYILYGPSAMLVYTTGKDVHGFTLENSLGEFILSHDPITCPEVGKIYSINDGLWNDLDDSIRSTIIQYREKKLTARYIGSFVADFHRNLLQGGIFMYPSTLKNPDGKLRLLYECNALSMVAERAGGSAISQHQRVLDIEPSTFHQRIPLLIGSKNMVDAIT